MDNLEIIIAVLIAGGFLFAAVFLIVLSMMVALDD